MIVSFDDSVFECSEETINQNLIDQPSLFAYYSTLYEMAKAEETEAERIFNITKEDVKNEMEIVEAELDNHYRNTLEKFTESSIKNKIKLNDIYIEKRAELLKSKREKEQKMFEAKRNAGLLKVYRDAIAQKKEILIALASNLRAQLDTDIILKEQHERRLRK